MQVCNSVAFTNNQWLMFLPLSELHHAGVHQQRYQENARQRLNIYYIQNNCAE
jgi:hypothetical protein